jgi:hypothetical protein
MLYGTLKTTLRGYFNEGMLRLLEKNILGV